MPDMTLGIDLSAQKAKTWACALTWDSSGRIEAIEFHERQTDKDLLALMGAETPTGIDAPFGWPRAYVDALGVYCASDFWPGQLSIAGDAHWSAPYRLRVTDQHVAEKTPARPLSVSADNLAVVAFRAAGLLTAGATSRGFDRTGRETGIYEVYPAGALAVWGLRHKGYKAGAESAERRREIVSELRDRLEGVVSDLVWRDSAIDMERVDHALDAFVSAIVARLAVQGRTELPSAHQEEDARDEGWIHLPVHRPPDLADALLGARQAGPRTERAT
jgi:hypothetical protein